MNTGIDLKEAAGAGHLSRMNSPGGRGLVAAKRQGLGQHHAPGGGLIAIKPRGAGRGQPHQEVRDWWRRNGRGSGQQRAPGRRGNDPAGGANTGAKRRAVVIAKPAHGARPETGEIIVWFYLSQISLHSHLKEYN